jgi:SAM-dependent methyltransferase
MPEGSVDLVFTSPPYCNALDYTRAHSFSVGWLSDALGTSQADYVRLGREYIGSERGSAAAAPAAPTGVPLVRDLVAEVAARDPRRGRILARYFADMQRVLAEAARILRPGGRLVLVVCPSHIRKVEVPTHLAFVEMGQALDPPGPRLTREAVWERTLDDRRRLLPYMQDAFGRRMRTEYVVVLRHGKPAPRTARAEA